MTIRDKLVENNRLAEVLKGIFVVAIKVGKPENYDTVVSCGYGVGGEPLYLHRITDLDTIISKEAEVFIILSETWTKMTTKNLFLKRDK